MFNIKFVTSIEKVGRIIWDELAKDTSPFCQYNFLHALEKSGSVGGESGWFPQHIVIYQNSEVVGILPLYKKTHSYGEYVFDFAWANTYRQYGMSYYPKLVSSIPFTPVTGARLMLNQSINQATAVSAICDKIEEYTKQYSISSMHWLFVEQEFSQILSENKQVCRRSVQFQWFNKQYTSFDNYLESLSSRRRKSIRNERAKVLEAGTSVVRLFGNSLKQEHLTFFYRCYQQTYLKRSGHNGYLTEEFFQQIFTNMHDNIMLVLALENEEPIASALFLYNDKQLCGRYWGALSEIDKLHFEACYYQGIEFCIEQGIQQFNPGTQGEHKILRGFEPIYCYSNHWLKELAFLEAAERFIEQENEQISQYKSNAEKLLPFKKADA